MLDVTIAIGVLNVTDSSIPGEETVGDIYGDRSSWPKISHILVDKVSGDGVLELCIKSFPICRSLGWGEYINDGDGIKDTTWDLHLTAQELFDGEDHSPSIVISVMVTFQVREVFWSNG